MASRLKFYFVYFSIDCLEEKMSHILTTEINHCVLFNSLKFLYWLHQWNLFKASAIYGSLVVTTFKNVITANELESWNQIKRLEKGGDSWLHHLINIKTDMATMCTKKCQFLLEWMGVKMQNLSSPCTIFFFPSPCGGIRRLCTTWADNQTLLHRKWRHVLQWNKICFLRNTSYWSQSKGTRGITQPGFLSI